MVDSEDEKAMSAAPSLQSLPFGLRNFGGHVRGEVRKDVGFGLYNLALLYILINNSVCASSYPHGESLKLKASR
jgi:hypothetical protein